MVKGLHKIVLDGSELTTLQKLSVGTVGIYRTRKVWKGLDSSGRGKDFSVGCDPGP